MAVNPSEALLLQQASKYATPDTIPYAQRSQYLADALASIQQSAQQGIRTPGALVSNLLAEALTQFAKRKADRQLLQQASANRQAMANQALDFGGLGQPDTSAVPGPQPGPAPSPAAMGVAPPPPTPSPQTPTPAMTPPQGAASDPRLAAMAELIKGGLQPHQAAGLVGNFVQESGPKLNIGNPGEGAIGAANWRGPRAQALKSYAAAHGGDPTSLQTQMAFALDELNGPESKAGAAIRSAQDPQSAAAAATGYERPAGWVPGGNPANVNGWDNRLRNTQQLMAMYQGGQGAPQGDAMPAQPQPPPQPMAPPTMPPQAPQPPAPPMSQQGGIPRGAPPTPQELQIARQLLGNPLTFDQGLQYAQKLKERAAAPIALSPNYYFDNQGHAVSAAQFQDVPSPSPNQFLQRGPDGQLHQVGNSAYGSLAPNTAMTSSGSVVPLQGSQPRPLTDQEMKQRNIPPGSAAMISPLTGEVTIQNKGYGPSEILSLRERVDKHPDYLAAQESSKAYNAMVGLAQQSPGGMRAYALRDTFARVINPGAVARVGTIQAIKEAQGIPENIKSFFLNIAGDGDVSPVIVQQIIDAAQPFAQSQWRAANDLNQANADFAQRHGLDPQDVTAPLPPAPQRFVLPQPKGPQAAPGPGVPAQAPPTGYRVLKVH